MSSDETPIPPGPPDDLFDPLVHVTQPEVEPEAPVAVLFCHDCGAALNPDTGSCTCRTTVPAPTRHTGGSFGPIRSALALYFTLLLTFVFVLLGEGVEYEMAVQVIDTVVVLVWCVVGWRYIRPVLRMPRSLWWWVVPVPLSVATFAIAAATIYPSVNWLGIEELSYTGPFIEAGYGWGVAVLLICFQPAVIEELAFRGVILRSLMHVLSAREAVIVSALLFMTLHLSFYSFPHLFFMGLVLGWMSLRSGSVLPGMVLHFCHNLICLLAEAKGY